MAMTYYRRLGEVPKKRHSQFRSAGGDLFHEELISHRGFAGGSLLYHRHPPTAITSAESAEGPSAALRAQPSPLLPRLFHTHDLEGQGDLVFGRRLLLGNEQVRISYVLANEPSELYRSAVGDEVLFIESGRARLESVFGSLEVGARDWCIVPSGTTHRWVTLGDEPVRALVVDCIGHVLPPGRYRSDVGQFLEGTPYTERDLRGPETLVTGEGEATVLVRHNGGYTRYGYAHHPFDVVGWDGYVWPLAFNVEDFEPIVGRYHQPPPVHQTFAGPGFVLCSFVPRPFDFGTDAIPVPYNHQNVDCDEVLFYVAGEFMSRKGAGIRQGSITLHPTGFIHGPQPGSVEASLGQPGTDEYAVMLDAFAPLHLAEAALETEAPEYAWSWAAG
jgi:homogentisate 1,2-dioxygenase